MIIEILGITPHNQGAVLMLHALCAKLREAYPHAKIAVPITLPAVKRLELGLWATPTHERPRIDLAFLAEIAPNWLLNGLGIIPSSKVDVILDASGFSYGDYWGARTINRRLTRYMRKWKRKSNIAVLMPQAFGPFEEQQVRTAFVEAVRFVDLIYVRDTQSRVFVEPLVKDDKKIRFAHDFTNLLKPSLPDRLDHLKNASFVIPNYRVVLGKGPETKTAYIKFLIMSLKMLSEKGHSAVILVHEGEGDHKLALEINSASSTQYPVLFERDVLATKALISNSRIVISSRFHGLVSALSSGVPSLACGWSHKYLELMSDYDVPENIVSLESPEKWEPLLETFISSEANTKAKAQLMAAAERERAGTKKMWAEIFELFDSRLS